jgi:WD40 repeat protein
VKELACEELASVYCHALNFNMDGNTLIACTSKGIIMILNISPAVTTDDDDDESVPRVEVRDSIDHKKRAGGEGTDKRMATITNVVCNSDGQWIAVSCVDNRVYIYDVDRFVQPLLCACIAVLLAYVDWSCSGCSPPLPLPSQTSPSILHRPIILSFSLQTTPSRSIMSM